MSNKYTFKYIIVGDSGVGKSCLMMRFIDKRFETSHDLTIGVEFGSYLQQIDNNVIKLQIWDTAGQESFRSITRSYYRGAIVAIIVFDVTSRKSFENIMSWYQDVINNKTHNITAVLVGNKIDKTDKRQISFDEAQKFASDNDMKYYETSAKDDTNVNDIFLEPAEEIYRQIKNKNIPEDLFVTGKKGKMNLNRNSQTTNNPKSCEC